jgi:hypothetical protein
MNADDNEQDNLVGETTYYYIPAMMELQNIITQWKIGILKHISHEKNIPFELLYYKTLGNNK